VNGKSLQNVSPQTISAYQDSRFSFITMTSRQFDLEIDAQRRDAVSRVWLKVAAFGLVFGALYGAITVILLQRAAI